MTAISESRHSSNDSLDDSLGAAMASQLGSAPWYTSSTAIHVLVFLIALVLMPVGPKVPRRKHKIKIVSVPPVVPDDDPPPPPDEPTPVVNADPTTIPVPETIPVFIDAPQLNEPIADPLDPDMDDKLTGKLDEMSRFDSQDDGSPAILGVGANGGKGGGHKSGFNGRGKRGKLVGRRYGPGRDDVNRLNQALRWLSVHQESDGHWDCVKYGGGQHLGDDVAVTSMALLAFLGNGNSARFGKYRREVCAATEWLLSQQQANGQVGPHRYTHALALMALSEAYGMGDKRIRKQAQNAVDWAVSSQCPSGGWNYTPNSTRVDTSVTGWWVMGLKSAYVAGLTVPSETIERAMAYMRKATNDGGNASYSSEAAALDAVKTGGGSRRMTAVSLTCLQFLGAERNDPKVVAARDSTLKHLPSANDMDFYLTYYQALGLFQTGLKENAWMTFVNPFRDMLKTTQVQVGTVEQNKGSWNPDTDPYGNSWGRVGQTALGALMLEVWWRYEQIYGEDGKQKGDLFK